MNVKQIRLSLNMTQKEFAQLLGVFQPQVSGWEQGQKVSKTMERHIERTLRDYRRDRTS